MYSFISVLLFSTLLSSSPQQLNFEGELNLEYTQKNKKTEYLIKFKNKNIRIDFVDEKGNNFSSFIINSTNNSIIELNHTRKNFRTVKPSSFDISKKNYKLDKNTKKTVFLQKYNCQNWTITDELNKKTITSTVSRDSKFKNIQLIFKYLSTSNVIFKYLYNLSHDEDIFLFSAVEYNENKKIVSKFSISKLNEKQIQDTYFKIPSNYKKW